MARRSTFGRLALAGVLGAAMAATTADTRAQSISPSLFSGLTWRCIGPFDGGPVASVAGTASVPGRYAITTPSGGAWTTDDGGDTWTAVDRQSVPSVPGDPQRWIDPGNPRRVVRVEPQGIGVSLDAGETWMSQHHLPIADVARLEPRSAKAEPNARTIAGKPATVSIADPERPGLIFAGTQDAVLVSFDNGATWQSLQLNLPAVAISDLDIRGNNLVAATQGRSVWQLDDITPLRQLSSTTPAASTILFKPADAILIDPKADAAAARTDAGSADVDYYLGPASSGPVTLDILDSDGRVVHSATSTNTASSDRWLAASRPLLATPGHHRIVWNLRLDPPPARKHQYAQLAQALSDMPADPNGPPVLPGTYRVRLTAAGQVHTQPLVVHNDPRVGEAAATLEAQRQRYDFEMKMYDAMQTAHREFLQLARVRAQLKPLLTSPDPDVAAAAAALDAQLASLDGSDWTGLVIPDADDEAGEVDEKEGKHPDFVPPKPVSVSKDYDDPTTILGRAFGNVDHAPAFAIVSVALGDLLKKETGAAGVPDTLAIADYERSCQQLSGVLDTWRGVNMNDLQSVNDLLSQRRLPPLPVDTAVSTIVCGSKAP